MELTNRPHREIELKVLHSFVKDVEIISMYENVQSNKFIVNRLNIILKISNYENSVF